MPKPSNNGGCASRRPGRKDASRASMRSSAGCGCSTWPIARPAFARRAPMWCTWSFSAPTEKDLSLRLRNVTKAASSGQRESHGEESPNGGRVRDSSKDGGKAPVTGAITLVRHGEPALSRRVKLDWKGYRDWWAQYELSGLLEGQTPPPVLDTFACDARYIYSSTLRRSIET